MNNKIRVVVVDDSALVRGLLSEIINRQPDMCCVGAAADPLLAREMIRNLNPDVITLDIEMPRMDGLSFLVKLMKHYPIPVIIVSSLTPANSDAAIRALSLGAVDVIAKRGSAATVPDVSRQLSQSIRAASRARVSKRIETATSITASLRPPPALVGLSSTHKVIALGASTGGTQALAAVLKALPANMPGIVVCQHMPARFTTSFARRLNAACDLEIREAGAHTIAQNEETCVVFGMPREAIELGAAAEVVPLGDIALQHAVVNAGHSGRTAIDFADVGTLS